ncbi:acetyl/propionyl/methylcrotonyl-CoA carboxylase subunit alpha [Gimibacter soli]|uniref:Acetyl/propionyl/methylcrotonyl-CoA carboxylase subunit alpha n=1 Tax=Gimibacter soli TaxID=3024400 RepID=A0AAE9XKS0_9PROT|nr:acetyl/propionyl/methylcrotonyl-CoA carboxylase subunit alpha [Gimibacter soli]WCL52688.1 acetyl/propionyl/methylcrotonyl-CoA carboxylase subunit alpha [Gimibacter soli]
MRKIRKLLIANRGEIAVRVMRTAKALGIRTVAVYSDADAKAWHVEAADEAVHIGPASAGESYLVGAKLLDAAKRTGADAIHPGYGFLSENPGFAEACEAAGIIFVGPTADAMRAMALKGAAKALMEDAKVPVVPGYHGADQSLETLTREAARVGYPVLLKAVAGGGGKGMRKVYGEAEIAAAVAAAKREGENSFGDGTLLIEKLIERPRHIEVQVFADTHGNAVHLFERDCSLQRRHQKVVEEAPAPGISADMRSKMGDAAVRAAKAIGYRGAGTVEFIVDVANGIDGAPFYFMEMNTRLQVEHPVTEAITGEDLVAWQLKVAEGETLPRTQDEIDARVKGHAVEVRLYAEDPDKGFLPATGPIDLFDPMRKLGEGCRIDAGVRAGDAVTIHYDPMVAKMIAYGPDRATAIDRLITLMEETPVAPLVTNRDFLIRALDHPVFRSGDVHTGFIAEHEAALVPAKTVTALDHIKAVLAIIAHRPHVAATDPWDVRDNFKVNLPSAESFLFDAEEGEPVKVTVTGRGLPYRAQTGETSVVVSTLSADGAAISATIDGLTEHFHALTGDDDVHLVTARATRHLKRHARAGAHDDDADGPGTIVTPMPGKVLEVKVKEGDVVEKGQPLLILEAMKMEQTLTAPRAGTVKGLAARAGEQVADGALLLTIEEA